MKRTSKQQRRLVIETLHKGFVWTCIGVTVYGFSVLGFRFYQYFTVTKPKLAEQQRLAQLSLLAEGSSENLKDVAPTIS